MSAPDTVSQDYKLQLFYVQMIRTNLAARLAGFERTGHPEHVQQCRDALAALESIPKLQPKARFRTAPKLWPKDGL